VFPIASKIHCWFLKILKKLDMLVCNRIRTYLLPESCRLILTSLLIAQAQEIFISNTAMGLLWFYTVDVFRPPIFKKSGRDSGQVCDLTQRSPNGVILICEETKKAEKHFLCHLLYLLKEAQAPRLVTDGTSESHDRCDGPGHHKPVGEFL